MQEKISFAIAFTHYLSIATLVSGAILLLVSLYFVYCFFSKKESAFLSLLSEWVLVKGFLISLFGTGLTLYFEHGIGHIPCELCWYQRVFLYVQVFTFGLAWFRKDRSILPYSLLLSTVGFCIATYHHLLQIGYDIYKPCSTALFAVDCAKPSFMEFGFVSFPLMSMVLFGFLILYTSVALFYANKVESVPVSN